MSSPVHRLARASLHAGLLALACLLSSCASAPTMSPTSAPAMPIALAEGRPTKLHTGDHFAFWIWHDSDNLWHIRTTTAGKVHRFQGMVHPTGPGQIVNMAMTSVGEHEGRRHRHDGAQVFQLESGDIVFDFSTDGREDGVDFQLTAPGGLECDFKIDGDSDPGVVYVGEHQSTPAKSHFILTP